MFPSSSLCAYYYYHPCTQLVIRVVGTTNIKVFSQTIVHTFMEMHLRYNHSVVLLCGCDRSFARTFEVELIN